MTDLTPAQIRATLAAGIISQEQANGLLTRAGASPLGDDAAVIGNENETRFIRGFSDVFIAIGVGLVVIGILVFASSTASGWAFLLGSAVMFGMAEYFGRIKRQHLPTFITAVGFMLFTIAGVGMIMGTGMMSSKGNVLAALITLAAMIFFYFRIRLPFCMALIALSVVYLIFSILSGVMNLGLGTTGFFLLACGIGILYWALGYDLRDKERVTRYADNAFWLHLVSAPLIIHGLVLMLAGNSSSLSNTTAFMVLLIVIGVSIFGIAINRRALLVSSLFYAGGAIGYFVFQADLSASVAFAITLLLLGGAIVFLGAGWEKARGVLLTILPKWKIFPPVEL